MNTLRVITLKIGCYLGNYFRFSLIVLNKKDFALVFVFYDPNHLIIFSQRAWNFFAILNCSIFALIGCFLGDYCLWRVVKHLDRVHWFNVKMELMYRVIRDKIMELHFKDRNYWLGVVVVRSESNNFTKFRYWLSKMIQKFDSNQFSITNFYYTKLFNFDRIHTWYK